VQDLATITVPVLVMAGDDDVATLVAHLLDVRAIPQGQLSIVPGSSHMLLKERTKECVRVMEHFLSAKLPPVTFAPLRRPSTVVVE